MIDLTLTQKEFLDSLKAQGKSFNTLKNYRADLEAFNKFLVLKKRPLKLTSFGHGEAQEYAQHLEELYASANSIRRRVQALRLFFDFLITHYHFPLNPIKTMPVAAKVLELPSPPPLKDLVKVKDHLLQEIQSQEELASLCARRNLIIFALIYEAGLKVSDLSHLELEDIIQDKKGKRVMVHPPKRDPYSIALSEHFFKIFSEYETKLSETWKMPTKLRYLLFNANPYKILSGALSARGIELIFEQIRDKTKVEITARNLRQACVFKWMNQQKSASQIKEWLGVAPDYDMGLYKSVFEKDKPLFLDIPYA
jgi:site-specific recombinase XerD